MSKVISVINDRIKERGVTEVKMQPRKLLFLSKRCKRRPKTKDEFYMETDFSKKTVTIGKGRNKISLNEMQVVLLAKTLSHQTRLLFDK